MRRVQFAAIVVGLSLFLAPTVAAGHEPRPATFGGVSTIRTIVGTTPVGRISRARVLAYWTPARIRAARSLDPAGGAGRVSRSARVGTFATASPPPLFDQVDLRGRATAPFQAVGGEPWTDGGTILRMSGKIFLSFGSSDFVCSGAVARDNRPDRSLVLTAAHCSYDQVGHRFATNWLFIPDWDTAPAGSCAATSFGCWTADGLVLHQGFASAGGFTDAATARDYSFVVVGPGGKTGTDQLDATVGSLPLSFSPSSIGDRVAAFGYPAAPPYGGHDLIWCLGRTFDDPQNSANPTGVACNMTPGSSGGPWLGRFSRTNGTGLLVSVTSYGYGGVAQLFGPRFDGTTRALLAAAEAATGNRIVH